jgi:hypothetical protein
MLGGEGESGGGGRGRARRAGPPMANSEAGSLCAAGSGAAAAQVSLWQGGSDRGCVVQVLIASWAPDYTPCAAHVLVRHIMREYYMVV